MSKDTIIVIPQYQTVQREGSDVPLYRGCTVRAMVVGLVASAFMAVAIPYSDMIIKGSQMGVWNTSAGAIFLFFVITVIINVVLGMIDHRLALDKSELAVVYIMLLIANTLPARGFSGYIPPHTTGAFYYASPENNWKELIHPYLPTWATVHDEDAVRRYYEGDASNPSIPWDAWAVPLLSWLIFGIALYVVMISITIILRKQWVEHERLIFPMMQLPLHMIRDDERRSVIKPFFRNPAMWIGFALPFIINNVDALHQYLHYIPSLHIGTKTPLLRMSLFRNTVPISLWFSFTLVGFSYFISKGIAAGLCFFYVLSIIEQGIFNVAGLRIDTGAVGPFGHYAGPIIMHQAMGAMIVLVLMGLWKTRGHLKVVFRKALRGDPAIDDSGEMMSYRQATLGGIAGLSVMTVWLWQAGIPLVIVPVLLFGCFVVFFTITRVVAEGGVAVMFPPINGPDFVASGMGTSMLGPRGGAGIALTYVWGVDTLIVLMTACSNGLKLSDDVGYHRRRLFWAIIVTIVVTILISLCIRLKAGYTYGAINFDEFYAYSAAHHPYRFMEKVVTSPTSPNIDGWVQIGVGALIMLLLEVLHYRFLWWPFHPLGFPISSAFGQMWLSVFVALIVKSVVLKYGGPTLYRRTIPFFLGLILGEIVPAGFWLMIDAFTGMHGNVLGSFMI
jgi:uncharacterized membrane protein